MDGAANRVHEVVDPPPAPAPAVGPRFSGVRRSLRRRPCRVLSLRIQIPSLFAAGTPWYRASIAVFAFHTNPFLGRSEFLAAAIFSVGNRPLLCFPISMIAARFDRLLLLNWRKLIILGLRDALIVLLCFLLFATALLVVKEGLTR